MSRAIGYDVWRTVDNGQSEIWVDTVFYDCDCSPEYVRESLIEHDGFPNDIWLTFVVDGEEYYYSGQ